MRAVWVITQKRGCRPSVSGEILQMCTQCFIHPTLGGEGWKTSQSSTYWLPSGECVLGLSKSNMWSYLETSRVFDGLSLLHLCPSRQCSPPAHLHLCFLSISHPNSLSHPVIPGLVVCPFGRLRGTVGERAVGRLCGHRARLFPQPASNATEPWPQWVLILKISVERNSASQTYSDPDFPLQEKRISPHPNCGQCPPFVYWSSRVGRPAATSQDKTSEKPIQHVIWPPGSIADSQGSNAGNLWGFSSMDFFIHWNLPFWQNSKWLMIFF